MPQGLFTTHICFYAVDPRLAREVHDRMAIRAINNWKGHAVLAARYFIPAVRTSTLAVAAK